MIKLVHRWVEKAIQLDLIEKENAEIFEYGLVDWTYSVCTWAVFMTASFFIGRMSYMLLFSIMYIPFRIYAGGIHFSNRMRCFLFSAFVIGFIFLTSLKIEARILALVGCGALIPSIIVISYLAPVEDVRKPLNKKESIQYHKIAMVFVCIEAMTYFVCFFMTLYMGAYIVGAAIGFIAMQLLLGKCKNYLLSIKDPPGEQKIQLQAFKPDL